MLFSETMSRVVTDVFGEQLYRELRKNRFATVLFWMAWAFAAVLAIVKRDRHILRMFGQGKSYVAALLVEQIVRNARAELDGEAKTGSGAIMRRFNQLPCTPKTRAFRAELIEQKSAKDDPILVIGDDDYLSVELCARGFRNVTVIDICPKVLKEIELRTAKMEHRPDVRACDLRQGLDPALRHRFKVVSTDPPCTIEGVGMFLRAALEAFASQPDATLVLTTHLLSQTEEGLRSLEQLFEKNRFAVEDVFQSSSVYPFPRDLRILVDSLLAILAFVVSSPLRRRLVKMAPKFFVSDTLVVKRT